MSNVLIVSSRVDYHARAVAWGLKQHGASVCFFDTTHFGGQDMDATFCINSDGVKLTIDDLTSFDAIYYRRAYSARAGDAVPKPLRKFIELEQNTFWRWILMTASKNEKCFWMDDPGRVRIAECKMLQLQVACDVGLKVPRTMISADPKAIRSFARTLMRSLVYKPLTGHFWIESGQPKFQTQAAIINDLDALDNASISACPGIYQELVDKVGDIRSVVVGNKVFSVLFRSSGDASEHGIDCRHQILLGAATSEPFEMPSQIEDLLLQITCKFGLTYSSADFALCGDGSVYFLELNPVGQFGFVEQLAPALPILDSIVSQLAQRRIDYSNVRARVSLLDFNDSEDAKSLLHEIGGSNSEALCPSFIATELCDT